ncbi:MAG: hypothetical protein JW395_0986 [Nitrospira sp.]|nr:hypothetical protein [Nitrospira sp.]
MPESESDAMDVVEGQDDELEFEGLAHDLAALSERTALPVGTTTDGEEPAPFNQSEVSFKTNDWLSRVVDVQAWLALDRPLGRDSEPIELLQNLFGQLVPGSVEQTSCFRIDDGVARLTARGAASLGERLDLAISYKEKFIELLDEGQSPAEASAEWSSFWDDAVSSQSNRQFGPIVAKVSTWQISTFVGFAEEGLLELNPSYQRDVVWSNGESQKLIESVLRGIPIPSVILQRAKTSDASERYQIVDGKQRLTAILRFIGFHPAGREYAATLKGGAAAMDKGYRAFARKNRITPRDAAEHFLPFRLGTLDHPDDPLGPLSGKYYSEIVDETIRIGSRTEKVKTIFRSVGAEYQIPVIVYEDTAISDIHKVFSLYNRQGKKLNAEELRNAVYHHLHLARLLLVLSGDRSDPIAQTLLADYLPPSVADRIGEVSRRLTDCGFGVARFKRTKVLSWVSAILTHKPNESAGRPTTPSTASHINGMLEALDVASDHPLRNTRTLIRFAEDLQASIDSHALASDAWAPRFRSKKGIGSKWEELPLVASLVATFLLRSIGSEGELLSKLAVVRKFTGENPGPPKTQNKTQWEYIASIAVGALGVLSVDEAAVNEALMERYGYSCLPTLRKLAARTP